MTKIAFIGAGSFEFTRKLVNDILTFPRLRDTSICLMDTDPQRLDFITRAVNRIVAEGDYPAEVTATMDRAEALTGADAVVCTILSVESKHIQSYRSTPGRLSILAWDFDIDSLKPTKPTLFPPPTEHVRIFEYLPRLKNDSFTIPSTLDVWQQFRQLTDTIDGVMVKYQVNVNSFPVSYPSLTS